MCVLYVSFGSKVRPRTFRCVSMGSAVLFILRSRLLLYSAGSGVNRVQAVLSGWLVCLLLCKEECSSPVSLQLLRRGIWACMRCIRLCWVLGWGLC